MISNIDIKKKLLRLMNRMGKQAITINLDDIDDKKYNATIYRIPGKSTLTYTEGDIQNLIEYLTEKEKLHNVKAVLLICNEIWRKLK